MIDGHKQEAILLIALDRVKATLGELVTTHEETCVPRRNLRMEEEKKKKKRKKTDKRKDQQSLSATGTLHCACACVRRLTDGTLTCEDGLGGGFSEVQGGLAVGVAYVGVGAVLQ